jgi:hypothetical protein
LFPFCSLFAALFAPSFLFLFPLCFVNCFHTLTQNENRTALRCSPPIKYRWRWVSSLDSTLLPPEPEYSCTIHENLLHQSSTMWTTLVVFHITASPLTQSSHQRRLKHPPASRQLEARHILMNRCHRVQEPQAPAQNWWNRIKST